MRRIDDARHAGEAGGDAPDEYRCRGVNVDQVETLAAQQFVEPEDRCDHPQWVERTRQGRRLDPKAGLAYRFDQGAIRAHADHIVPRVAHGDHERQQELIETKIDGAELADFHLGDVLGRNVGSYTAAELSTASNVAAIIFSCVSASR